MAIEEGLGEEQEPGLRLKDTRLFGFFKMVLEGKGVCCVVGGLATFFGGKEEGWKT